MGTFYVKTDSHQLTEGIKKLLKDRNMKEGSFPVDFVFLAGAAAYYRNRMNLKGSALSNTIQGPSMDITNKVELHKMFKDKSFILSSDIVPPVPKLPSKFVKILKPLGGFSGEGITVTTSKEEIEEYKKMSHIFLVFDKKTYNIMGIFDERIEADKLQIILNVKDVEIQIKELELSSYTNEELENLIFLKERKEKRLSYGEEEKYRFVTIYSRRNIPFKIVL